MKTTLLLIAPLVIMLAGCATSSDSQNGQTAEKQTNKKQPEKPPEVGMTKEQVIAMYGKTDNITTSSKGEVWTYNMNMGEAFIPFNFGYRPKLRIIHFDQEGKVAEWSYSK